jgi:hypothetical protein
MSEPKRVNFSAVIVHHIGGEKEAVLRMYFENDGMFVSYEDYARLKAEVERRGEENAHLHKGIYSLSLNVAQLKDAVERLTKAGDAMVKYAWNLNNDFQNTGDYEGFFSKPASEIERIWNAAKEGKPRA